MTAATLISRSSSSSRVIGAALLALVVGLIPIRPAAGQEPALLFPDLRPLAAQIVLVDFLPIEGVTHYVLRFDATIWNTGRGPLELHGGPGDDHAAFQRIYDDSGGYKDEPVSSGFTYFEPHQHWHFENFAEYQLWPKSDFDDWLASGRTGSQQPTWVGSKTTGQEESFCIRDSDPIQQMQGSPVAPAYNVCDQDLQGISVGWGDTYPLDIPQQWIDLGTGDLPDGLYVLRIVADPLHVIDQGNRDDLDPYAEESLTVFQRAPLETEVLPNPYAPAPQQ
jgi:lysyl oxidase